MSITRITALIIILITIVSTWILGIRMRRRIRWALGKEVANEMELTSLSTWMAVEDAEEREHVGKVG